MNTFNPFSNRSWFLRVCRRNLLKTLWEKGEIAHYEQFLLFPTVFSTLLDNFLPYFIKFKIVVCKLFSLKESKVCRLGKSFKKLTEPYSLKRELNASANSIEPSEFQNSVFLNSLPRRPCLN